MAIDYFLGEGGKNLYIYLFIYLLAHSYIRASIFHIHIQRKMPDVAKQKKKKRMVGPGAWM